MVETMMVAGAVLAFAIGIYIGLGAPGWPVKPEARANRLEKRSINPIAWGRTGHRERMSPRSRDDRRQRLR